MRPIARGRVEARTRFLLRTPEREQLSVKKAVFCTKVTQFVRAARDLVSSANLLTPGGGPARIRLKTKGSPGRDRSLKPLRFGPPHATNPYVPGDLCLGLAPAKSRERRAPNAETKGFLTYRVIDRGRHHSDHCGDRDPEPLARSHGGQRFFGGRFDSHHQHGGNRLFRPTQPSGSRRPLPLWAARPLAPRASRPRVSSTIIWPPTAAEPARAVTTSMPPDRPARAASSTTSSTQLARPSAPIWNTILLLGRGCGIAPPAGGHHHPVPSYDAC